MSAKIKNKRIKILNRKTKTNKSNNKKTINKIKIQQTKKNPKTILPKNLKT